MNNSLFGATNIVKNIDKEKYVYSGYVITFDSAGLCNFDNDFTRNVILVTIIVHLLSSQADNRKNNF